MTEITQAIKLVSHHSPSTRRPYVCFEIESELVPTREQVADLQTKFGFHPGGYGSPTGISSVNLENGNVKTTWNCWHSCD